MRGVDHPDRGHSRHRRRSEPPHLPEPVCVRVVDGEAEAVRRGLRPHLGSALDAAVASNRHETAFLAANDPSGEPEVHDRLHVVHAEPVVRDPHAPDEDRGPRLMVHPGEREHPVPGHPGLPLELLPGQRRELDPQVVEARRMFLDERLVDPAVVDEVLQDAVDEGDVAPRVDREEFIGEARAPDRAVGDRRHPVPGEARFSHRVHDRDFRAHLLCVVEILHRHRLVVRDVGAEEDDQVASDPVRVRTRRGGDADGFLQPRGARRVTRAARVVDVVRPEEPGDLVRDVVRLVRHAAGRDEERDPIRGRGANSCGRGLQRFLPGNSPEAGFPVGADHRERKAAELPQVFRGFRPKGFGIPQDPNSKRSHRVQREEVQADRAQVDPLHREVSKSRRAEGAPIADAVSEDPPGEEGRVLVVPGGSQDFAVVVRFREPEAKRDRAHAPDTGPLPLRSHDSGMRPRLIFPWLPGICPR